MPKGTILVVDDMQPQRWAIARKLAGWDYEVLEAADGASALDTFSAQLPEVVLLDLRLPDQSGLDVLRQIRTADPGAVVIMVTAHGEIGDAVAGFRLGLFDFLLKPLDFDALRVTLRYGLEARRLRAELTRWRQRDQRTVDDGIVAGSPAMAQVLATTRKVAASGATTVLLAGESGTGKDLFGKAIHYGSPRAAGPFIAVNCAAIAETLVESELFGHEKGAFTDAKFLKKGVFELADGGTLYLDEISQLKSTLQAKLLRVLETPTFRRVGGERPVSVDVRVVAATNTDLTQAVRAGEFREDLLYRLRVIELRLPPLRDRPEDIPVLIDRFLQDFAVKFRKTIAGVTPQAMKLLCEYRWPGNVRELRNAIERAVILEESDRLTPKYLPDQVGGRPGDLDPAVPPGFVLPPSGLSLEAVERSLVRQALALTGQNRTKAARLLDISRDALRYRLKRFSLGATSTDPEDPPPIA